MAEMLSLNHVGQQNKSMRFGDIWFLVNLMDLAAMKVHNLTWKLEQTSVQTYQSSLSDGKDWRGFWCAFVDFFFS